MENKTGKIIMAASGVIALGATLYWVWKKFIDVDDDEEEETQAPAVAEKKEEEIADLPVSKKTMIKIYSEISESVEVVMMQLSKYEEQLSKNPAYTPEMVNQEIASKFEQMLTAVEAKVYEMNEVKPEDAAKAYQLLSNDRDFKRATYRLRSMFALMQGETPEAPDLPEFVTLSFTIDVMREVMGEAGKVMTSIITKKKAELNITDNNEFKTKISTDEDLQKTILEDYMKELDVKRQEILEKNNIDKAVLQIAMMTYQNDPSFQQAMIEISSKQQEQLMEIGFAA